MIGYYDMKYFRISCRQPSCSLVFDSEAEMQSHYLRFHKAASVGVSLSSSSVSRLISHRMKRFFLTMRRDSI